MINALHLCGPFLSASIAVNEFGQNVYQASLLGEAIDMYAEYETKIQEALDENKDEEYISSLKAESEYYEQIFKISLASFILADEV